MTHDTTAWIFVAGVLTGIAVSLIAQGVAEHIWIVRYLRRQRRRPPAELRSMR